MARRRKTRIPKYAVAIVGEGESEWHYFTSLKRSKRFSFKVVPELPSHSNAKSIIEKAHALVHEGYDKVYCVLDLDVICISSDTLARYDSEKRKAIKKSKGTISFIESMPCFELWFLIHFIDYSAREYLDYISLKPQLKKFIADYEKTERFFRKANFFDRLVQEGSIEKATATASRLLEAFERSGSPTHPRTSVHELIAFLEDRK